MLTLKTVENIPKPVRGNTRNSDERKQIQDQLKTGKGTLIEGVETGKAFNNLQQRIRAAGEAIGVKVTITFQKHENGETGDLYFQATEKKAKAKTNA